MIEARPSRNAARQSESFLQNDSMSISARLGRLQFHNSGKFRVLQVSDIQDGPKISADTISLLAAACDASRPDVVIFTGDQIAGYDAAYAKTFRKRRWGTGWDGVYAAGRSVSNWFGSALQGINGAQTPPSGDTQSDDASLADVLPEYEQLADSREQDLALTKDLVRHSIAQFLAPLIKRGIPFAVTYGNHDFQCGLDTAEMDAIYREFPGCLNPEATAAKADQPRRQPGSGLPDQVLYALEPGSFALPVTDVSGKRNVLGLTLIDSGDYAKTGGYGVPSRAALGFLAQLPRLLHTKSIVFQHIPLPQFYELLRPVPTTTPYAIQGYRAYDAQCYVLDESVTMPGSYLGEGISCPDTDCGEFEILRRSEGYFAVFAGHDHRNGFVGEHDGIMLGATPTCGFGSYGPVPRKRAVRLFEFDIRHPHSPRTQLLEFGDLVGKPQTHKAYTFAMSHMPSSTGDAVNLLRKPGVLAGGVATLAALFASVRASRKKH
jgi:hypothetical protein